MTKPVLTLLEAQRRTALGARFVAVRPTDRCTHLVQLSSRTRAPVRDVTDRPDLHRYMLWPWLRRAPTG